MDGLRACLRARAMTSWQVQPRDLRPPFFALGVERLRFSPLRRAAIQRSPPRPPGPACRLSLCFGRLVSGFGSEFGSVLRTDEAFLGGSNSDHLVGSSSALRPQTPRQARTLFKAKSRRLT